MTRHLPEPALAPPAGEASDRTAKSRPQRDADLKQQARNRLNADPLVNQTEIDVQVDQGCVTRSGTVSNPETIQNAPACLSQIARLVMLHNALKTRAHDRRSALAQKT